MTEWAGKNLLCYGDNLGFLTDRQLATKRHQGEQ
jgi:hypothetical protein